MEFSLVVAIRDTPQDRDFAVRSLQAAGDLRPTETIIGVDEPASPEFLDAIGTAASGHAAPRIMRVGRSDEWEMHLAHVIHKCYGAARCQKVLTYNIDTILQRGILRGYGTVGPDIPLVMYQAKRLSKKPRDVMTGIIYRLHQIINAPDSGTYWLHRQTYFDHVDSAGFREIVNGYDTFLIERMRSAGMRVVADSSIGAHCLDYNNNDIPWRQFANGVWHGANRDRLTGYFASMPRLKIRVKSVLLDMPYLYRGFEWATRNPNHPAVESARSKSYTDFTHQGSAPIEGILDWKGIGKLGVGYT